MNPKETFFEDFFNLGKKKWLNKYGSGNFPQDATAEWFVSEIQKRGLELRLIDQPPPEEGNPEGNIFLIRTDDPIAPYHYISIVRGFPMVVEKFAKLSDGMLAKMKQLFNALEPFKQKVEVSVRAGLLELDGKQIKLPYKVLRAEAFSGRVLAILDWEQMPKSEQKNNLVALNDDGSIRWQLKNGNPNIESPVITFYRQDSQNRLGFLPGYDMMINVETGELGVIPGTKKPW